MILTAVEEDTPFQLLSLRQGNVFRCFNFDEIAAFIVSRQETRGRQINGFFFVQKYLSISFSRGFVRWRNRPNRRTGCVVDGKDVICCYCRDCLEEVFGPVGKGLVFP
ncbi:hypothetical protein CBW56_16645 [Denitratisoma oestradiolicum]|nr:hypothetical protein CBW56_16645 [Denitratisoma oestradiolicum]